MRRHRTHVIRKGLRSGEISRCRPSQAPNVSSKPSSHVCTPSTEPRDVVLPEWKPWGLCGKSWSKIWVIAWANALKECPIDWSRSSISWWTKFMMTRRNSDQWYFCVAFQSSRNGGWRGCLLGKIQCSLAKTILTRKKISPTSGSLAAVLLPSCPQRSNYHSLPKTPVIM